MQKILHRRRAHRPTPRNRLVLRVGHPQRCVRLYRRHRNAHIRRQVQRVVAGTVIRNLGRIRVTALGTPNTHRLHRVGAHLHLSMAPQRLRIPCPRISSRGMHHLRVRGLIVQHCQKIVQFRRCAAHCARRIAFQVLRQQRCVCHQLLYTIESVPALLGPQSACLRFFIVWQ